MFGGVVGASGVVGRNFVPRLLEAGHHVRAGGRWPDEIRAKGRVEAIEVDILDMRSVVHFIRGCDTVVNLASSIPRADKTSGSWQQFDEIRRQGTRNLMQACDDAGADLLAQSVSMLHSADTSRLQNERDPLLGPGILASGYDQEQMLSAWSGSWRIVRGGSLYGPGTSTDDSWFEKYDEGELRAPGDGDSWASMIHIADLAAAFLTVMEKAPPRTAWIAADDQPMRWREIFDIVATLAANSQREPGFGADHHLPSFRVSNGALRSLGWAPRYASVRSGLVATAEKRKPGK